MEEEIKVLDKDVMEYEKEKEDSTRNKKSVTLVDIIIIQLILCIIVVIIIIVLDMVKSDISKEIISYTKSQINKPYQMSPQITDVVEKIKGMLNV